MVLSACMYTFAASVISERPVVRNIVSVRCLHIGNERLEADGMATDEVVVQHAGPIKGDRVISGFEDRLYHTLQECEIATDTHLVDRATDRCRTQGDHLDGSLGS